LTAAAFVGQQKKTAPGLTAALTPYTTPSRKSRPFDESPVCRRHADSFDHPVRILQDHRKMSPLLTPRGAEILRRMRDAQEGSDESELVYAPRVGGFLGSEPVARRTVFQLIRLCAVSLDKFSTVGVGLERYTINETGRKLLE
jgi:hypothetical protein